jgi:hypothetical protein
MRVAILQPGYLPWLGYFEQMAAADCFVALDDVQYTKQDWRNRNRIRTNHAEGWAWLTVPVEARTTRGKICDVRIQPVATWWPRHLRQLDQHYRTAPHYAAVRDSLQSVLSAPFELLADLDLALAAALAELLQVSTPVVRSRDLAAGDTVAPGDRTGRLLALCQAVGATELYDGKAAQAFLEVDRLAEHGVAVRFQEYEHPVYPQVYGGEFVSHLSAVDLLACCGPDSGSRMRAGGLAGTNGRRP